VDRPPLQSGFDFGNDEPAAAGGADAPLAARMRPRTLDEVYGQDAAVGPGSMLRELTRRGRLPSVILWGPPGCGKTTIARLLARSTDAAFVPLSAVTSGVADLRRIIGDAERARRAGRRTVVFIDEIHRFNRAQQDVVLPHVEEGTITLIGATTENPSFEVVAPLLSRVRVVRLQALSEDAIAKLVDRALADQERGLGNLGLALDPEARALLTRSVNGDARAALTALEIAADLALARGSATIDPGDIAVALQDRRPYHDRQGDAHYDTISAFIKSVRGSDPDAALHYLARMLAAGEDPRCIARRLIILASEDVGNADPQGLVIAVAAAQAVERVGMPEGRIILAQATTYLASASKSNASYLALESAARDVASIPLTPIPEHLRNAPVKGYEQLGFGAGYLYPHDYPGHYVEQRYLPDGPWNVPYYRPSPEGYEARIRDRRKARGQSS
jgi:putative ATPase